jgi:Beta-glucosidase-related glycosidases
MKYRKIAVGSCALLTALLYPLTLYTQKGSSNPSKPGATAVQKPVVPPAAARVAPDKPDTVERWMRSLPLEKKVAQLVMITSYGEMPRRRAREYREFVRLVRDVGVGGVIVVNRVENGIIRRVDPYVMATFLNRMQRQARIPLLVGGDFERGASMRVTDTTKYPHAMAYAATGDLEATRRLGAATAREARALGVHWVFAPVADVNNNPDNPVINIRSFGEDPVSVGQHVRAFIEGARREKKHPVLLTVKHFPGHGDTAVDSHKGMPRLDISRERMNAVELVPFREAIDAGVDSVMTAHMAVPAMESEEIPATVSRAILTDLLRKELGFKGLVVTDAMDMNGLSKELPPGEAAVRAIEAGVDLLLMPPNPDVVIKAVVEAVRKGRITEARIDASLRRLLSAKVRLGLHRQRLVNLEAIADTLDSEEALAEAQSVADRAVTLVKNDYALVPLKNPQTASYFILTESRFTSQGRRLMEELARRVPRARIQLFAPSDGLAEFRDAAARAASSEKIVVLAFVSSARGDVPLPGNYPFFMNQLYATQRPIVLASLGSPYLLQGYPASSVYLTTCSPVEPSEAAVVRALFGEIPITGRLPVSIPQLAKVGDGIQYTGQTVLPQPTT